MLMDPGAPEFFKVLMDSSSPHLMLPVAFVRRHLEEIPENPTLKTATGEHSWRMKLRNIDGSYRFTQRWKKLVRDCLLEDGDFLVFSLIDRSTFQFRIYDIQGNEKHVPSANTNVHSDCCRKIGTSKKKTFIKIEAGGSSGGGHEALDDGEIMPENLSFVKVISKTHKYTMALPRKFVEAAGIGNRSALTIKDFEGKEWVVGLAVERYRSTKFTLSSGWSIFRKYHELSDGDICLFKFIRKEGTLYLAQLTKKKSKTQRQNCVKIQDESSREVKMKRKRGRPPLGKAHGGGVDVDSEDVNKKRGKRPLEEPRGGGTGGVNVKIEDESGPEAATRKRRRRPLFGKGKPHGGSDSVEVKNEDEEEDEDEDERAVEAEVVARKRGRPRLEKFARSNRGCVKYF